jgi:hypothetical protein
MRATRLSLRRLQPEIRKPPDSEPTWRDRIDRKDLAKSAVIHGQNSIRVFASRSSFRPIRFGGIWR